MDMERPYRELRASASEPVPSYADLYENSPMYRIRLAKNGVPAEITVRMAADFGFTQKVLRKALNLKSFSTAQKTADKARLPVAEGERALGLARLVGQVEAMVQETGDPTDFNAATWLSGWLQEPLPALGGEKAIDFLDTMEGQALVSRILIRIQSGTFA